MCLEYDTADYVTDVFSCSKVVYAVIMQFIYDVSMKTYSYDSSQKFKHDLWRVKSELKLSQNHIYTIVLKTNKNIPHSRTDSKAPILLEFIAGNLDLIVDNLLVWLPNTIHVV